MEDQLIQESFWQKTSTKIGLLLIILLALFGGIAYLDTISSNNNNSTSAMSSELTTQTLENGLTIEELEIGTGREVTNGDTVSMHYTGFLEDGTVFDSSLDRGQPFEFRVGAGQVIQGWEQGIPGVKIGGRRKLTIPSDLAYGEQGIPGAIPGGATLIFEVEALDAK